MQAPLDSLRRFCFDVAVTLVLIFAGIGVAGLVNKWLGLEIVTVYLVLLIASFIPVGLWLHRCRVLGLDRIQLITYVFTVIGLGIAFDVAPVAWRGNPLWFAAVYGATQLIGSIFERTWNRQRGAATEPAETAD